MANDLGFGNTGKKLDLSDFKQEQVSIDSRNRQEEEAADQAAERVGFGSREPTTRVMRERKSREPNDHCFVRAPISILNRFKQYCNHTGQSYGEALSELMDKADI